MVTTLEDSRGPQKATPRSRHREADIWGRPDPPADRPTPWPHMSVPLRYVDYPPPPRLHLHHSLSRFDPRAHVGRSELYIPGPAPLRHQVI
jgi:hypothetical protein